MPKKGQLDADEMRALKAKKEAAKKADVKARAAAAAKAEEKRQKEARQKAKAAEVAKKKADREKAKAAGAKLPSAGGPPAEALALQAQLMPVVKEAERLESLGPDGECGAVSSRVLPSSHVFGDTKTHGIILVVFVLHLVLVLLVLLVLLFCCSAALRCPRVGCGLRSLHGRAETIYRCRHPTPQAGAENRFLGEID